MSEDDEPSAGATSVTTYEVSQRFGAARVLNAVSLDIAANETVALLGPSGCGKTTLLRLLAGLARPTGGRIAIGGRVVADADSGAFVPPEARGIGMVFQDYALWPHMSVAGNVAFPLEMRGVNRADRETRTREALALVGLEAFGDRQPGTLSGGQQQRVALARAVVAKPQLILFDEPLSNLDRELRESLVIDISAILRRFGITAVYVTHDHSEAFAIADRVAILSGGSMLQIDRPEEIVDAPASIAVAEFLKLGLVLEARIEDGVMLFGERHRIRPPRDFCNGNASGHLFVPRNAMQPANAGEGALRGTALHTAFRGDGYAIQLMLESGPVVGLHSPARIAEGAPVDIAIAWERAAWFSAAHTTH